VRKAGIIVIRLTALRGMSTIKMVIFTLENSDVHAKSVGLRE